MSIKTTHAVHWREDEQLCRVSIDSETRHLTLTEGTYTRWLSRGELRSDIRAMRSTREALNDLINAHYPEDEITEFVLFECRDGAVTWEQLCNWIGEIEDRDWRAHLELFKRLSPSVAS